ncbi:holo-ACP synthase [Paenibacillus sp. GCM10012307]|uniref:Holo-[acyl-carrier-protein] synthase n=1 Tax=Paenibacillus roseus TaxID=2798579 RepID=A0A934MRE4_9BACL|nr:holo-ACP synthase [Paenibacillus roseus]MBJ6362813.1 holo-ACP synthase [Paenibacillus roseus]
MILGIGHDVTDINRISQLLSGRTGRRFMERVLTRPELELADSKGARLAEFVAGRFAAKEAIVKAFGCGIGNIIGFTDIVIIPDDKGKPGIALSPEAWDRLGLTASAVRMHVSITHERTMASAFVIVEEA